MTVVMTPGRARLVCPLLLALAVLSGARPAAAQSRAEEIAKQQAARRATLRPNEANRAERLLDWFEDHYTDPNTGYVTFGGIYPSGGFAPGLGWRHAAGQARFNVNGAYSVRSYKLAQTSVEFPELAGGKFHFGTHARWVAATQVPFYGLGNDTLKEARTSYGLRTLDVGADAIFRPVRWFHLGAGVAADRRENREGTGRRRPSIETVHSALSAPGLFSEPKYMRSTASLAVDWRESPGYTRSGGLYSVAVHDFRDSDDGFSFRRLDVDLRQFVPVLKEHWVFGFRALFQTTMKDDDQVIPFYMLPSLGGKHSVRAYPDFRFQDEHLLLLGVEYRWLPSRILDMALFYDAGKVAPRRGDLDLDGLKTAYGIGARFHGPTFVPLRLDLAHGREGFRLQLTGGVPF